MKRPESPASKKKAPVESKPPIPAKKISLTEHSYAKHPRSKIKLNTEQRNYTKKIGAVSKHLATWQ